MSITRIHAIKATVKRSIDYICNPAKTDGETLITAFGTTVEYAPAMFANALKKTDPSDPNLAYHLIQSFAPGEVGAKEAHEIGKELAERLLGGRYSYIVSTHTDKNHCHNHIIFCAADNITHKKYHDCKRSYWNIRHINDELCEEHNLSVIKENKHIGKSYKEWMADKAGTSWKSKLKSDINETIKQAHTYDEFLDLMKSKGYEIKDAEISPEAHKYIGFRAPGQERWVRGRPKSLGDDFTKERIRERIEEKAQDLCGGLKNRTSKQPLKYSPKSLGEDFTKERIRERIEEKARIRAERMKRLTKRNPSMIDTTQDKFAESPGLMRWAEKQNLKAAAQIQSKLAEMGLDSFDALDAKIESLHKQAKEGKKATIALDKDITRFEDLLHYAHVYNENKKYIRGYEKSKDKERYYRTHGYDIEIANGAIDRLKNAGLDPDRIDLQKMESDYAVMTADREKTSSAYKAAEKECEKLKKLRDDLTSYVGTEQSLDIERDVKRTL